MKPFGQWLNEQRMPQDVEPPILGDELVTAYCCVCGIELDPQYMGMEPEDVTEDDYFYCGGSPSCCP